MVDFPEGYDFAPGARRMVMQETFAVDIGVFGMTTVMPTYGRRKRSPYTFTAIGYVRRDGNGTPIRGILYKWGDVSAPPIEGTLQQVVTALCTIHRMTGEAK